MATAPQTATANAMATKRVASRKRKRWGPAAATAAGAQLDRAPQNCARPASANTVAPAAVRTGTAPVLPAGTAKRARQSTARLTGAKMAVAAAARTEGAQLAAAPLLLFCCTLESESDSQRVFTPAQLRNRIIELLCHLPLPLLPAENRCTCAPGYSGATCTTDACESSPCKHGGTCDRGPDTDYTCRCANGYEGNTVRPLVSSLLWSFSSSLSSNAD